MTVTMTEVGEYWTVAVTTKSGKSYGFGCLLNSKPTYEDVVRVWNETRRKHWNRIEPN